MCAEFMDTTMKKDKESEKLSKDENASPAAASKMPCNYRRLESFEGDIWKQPLPVMNAYSGPIDTSTDDLTQRTIRACEDADRTLQADDNIMFAKSVRKIPTADVAEIQRLREQGLSRIEAVQRKICELEVQLSESTSELDMERALIAGELSSEKTNLTADERSCDELKDQIISLEEEYIAHREKHQGIVDKEKRKLQQIQKKVSETRKQMDKCPESMRGSIEATLQKEQEELEQESRRFEDAEFNSLETMSRLDEEKEVMQRTLIRRKRKLEMQIDNRKGRVASLQQQLDDITAQQTQENQRLNNERDEAIGSLQGQREETTLLERKYYQLTGEFPPSVDTPVSLARSHRRMSSTTSSRSDVFKRQISSSSSKVDTTKIFNFSSSTDLLSNASKSRPLSGDKSMGYNEFDRSSPISTRNNDHLMALQQQIREGQTSLSPVTTSLLSSRQKLNSSASPIYQRLNSTNGQSRATSADKWKDTTSISSMDSLDTTLSTWSIQSPESHDIEKLLEMEQLIADATAEKKRLLAEVGQKLPPNTSPTTSPSHEEMSQVKLRSSNGDRRQARPMTRYLPVRGSDFNLRHHIESCGHNPSACRHLSINATSCRGYMTKMGGRIKTWRKRWFVFDRISKTLSYYSDKHEIKLKGMIYFHAMEDVFFDHLKGHKSPNPSLTFCVKCFDRIYYLVAPSCESMRIWMDTLVTGSEGYREYMKTFE
uniref:PH domain-containing protein n=1 Tax=Ciona savignyi TaxID=51511 RepID=H2YL23_CIOSA